MLFVRKRSTYDHRIWRMRGPVRSPIAKPDTARLVVGSVTTSESLVLYVLHFVHIFSDSVQGAIPYISILSVTNRLLRFVAPSRLCSYWRGSIVCFVESDVAKNRSRLTAARLALHCFPLLPPQVV